jgi:hypothetical protein
MPLTELQSFNAKKMIKGPTYPIPYTLWHAHIGTSKSISDSLDKNSVLARTDRELQEATPIAGAGSPWAIFPKGDFPLFQKMLECGAWVQGKKGITCDLNGIYFVKVVSENAAAGLVQIETRPDAGKIDIGLAQRFWIEPGCLYPLLKGAGDLALCGYTAKEQLYAIVPNKGITKAEYRLAEDVVENQSPKLYQYFCTCSELLKSRSTYRGRMKNAPFYAIYNVGKYTFAPWKVVWAEQPGTKQFPAAVVGEDSVPLLGNRPVVPDHKVFFVDFNEPEPAFYLCGMLMGSIVQTLIKSHHIMIQVGNIFKHMSVPPFNTADGKHSELANLTKNAHSLPDGKAKFGLLKQISNLADGIIKKL